MYSFLVRKKCLPWKWMCLSTLRRFIDLQEFSQYVVDEKVIKLKGDIPLLLRNLVQRIPNQLI